MNIKITWRRLLIALVALPAAAVFGAWVGLFNIGAASGHWPITNWFLHFAMQSSVRTYALGVEAPDRLPEEGLQAAAGHFEKGCAVCHALPGIARDAWTNGMLPAPPSLTPVLSSDKWSNAELFRIVKYGVRFSGMPAWPTQNRDDEIWAMVAFLRTLPELDREGYRDLAYGPSSADELGPTTIDLDAVIADCARCHGEGGMGRGEAVPVLAGQRSAYLELSLHAYANEMRHSGVMELAALEADPGLYDDLAAHFSQLPVAASDEPATGDGQFIDAGREIAKNGIAERDVPACDSCHARPDRNPAFPIIEGQKRHYLAIQLELFAEEKRGGAPLGDLMDEFAHHLEPSEIEALAAYYASLPFPAR